VTPSASEAVAVRTDDVTLRGLCENLRSALEGCLARAKGEALLSGVAVVEVHLVAGEPAAPISAGDLAELPQERRRGGLPLRDALDLALSVGSVVADGRRSLISRPWHASL
jgi:hypothetical protein